MIPAEYNMRIERLSSGKFETTALSLKLKKEKYYVEALFEL